MGASPSRPPVGIDPCFANTHAWRGGAIFWKGLRIALRYAHSAARTKRVIVDPSPAAAELFQSTPGDMAVHELSLYLGTGFAF